MKKPRKERKPRRIKRPRRRGLYNALKHQNQHRAHKPPVRPICGPDAMFEEYAIYKAAGMLAVWRDRWKAYLEPNL